MPRRRSDIGRRTRQINYVRHARSRRTEEEHAAENEQVRNHSSRVRENITQEQRQMRSEERRVAYRRVRSATRATNRMTFLRLAFDYDPTIDYNSHRNIDIGNMDKVCAHCQALKYETEAPGLCCVNGQVKLTPLQQAPEPLLTLVSGTTSQSKHFLTNIRKYNSCFQMTSFGADKIITDHFMPTFKVQGQIYHTVGSLLPISDEQHKFLQIYFLGSSDDEVNTRCAITSGIRRQIVESLQMLLDQHNQLVKLFKTAIDRMPSDNHKIVIRADKTPGGEHSRRFNAPTINEIAIVIGGDQFEARDIVLHRRNDTLQRVSETHRSYDALQYPILFWQGDDGYHFHLKMINPTTGTETTKKISCMNYYAYRLMIRENGDNHILKCRQLFHQYVVDMYAKIETERLLFIRLNQRQLRSEEYIHLRDAINTDGNANNVGRITILPSTYTGSPRHMHEYAQDAMSYVRHYGRPDLFITFTCNPTWNEIKQCLLPGQSHTDRHDITARVFKQKLKSLMGLIVKYNVFGSVRCWMYSIEWQKRGLPHAHILIWCMDKIQPNEVDGIICAEIPDSAIDSELFQIITKNMIHGPCGALNLHSPCMIDGKCSKRYPKQFIPETITGNDGYPLYRRRSTHDNGKSIMVKVRNNDVEIDNRWIVPYSPLLSKIYKAHINVEYCNSVKSIKYICKYVNKGSDMAIFGVAPENNLDEIRQYQLGRYISSNEAIWRIFAFPIHERYPTVVHLAVHLENGQRVYFTTENVFERAAQPPATTLTAFFALCQTDDFAGTLLYSEVPRYFTWNATRKTFERRKQGKPVTGHPQLFSSDALGRLYTVHPNMAECYYLRLLLITVRGPTSFHSLRTVNGVLCESYRDACQHLHLLENDEHWDNSLHEASLTASSYQMRTLFAIIISTCFPSRPVQLWEQHKDAMTDDILHQARNASEHTELQYTAEMYNQSLIYIEDMCLMMANKLLNQLGLPSPNRTITEVCNREIQRETQYDTNALHTFVQDNITNMNQQQTHVYNTIMQAINENNGELYFLDAPGGTGKTYLIALILATVRSNGNIALAIASSGIAATLLDGGRTAHSALKLPLNMQLTETPTCNISKTSAMAKVLQQCKIIIWDECTMAHKKSLEALDRTLRDLRTNQQPFVNAIILLAGDFRQTLPVIARSTPADQLNACLKSSHLWRLFHKLSLTVNMRVQLQNDASANSFASQLLDVGNGKCATDNTTGLITLPADFCVTTESQEELIASVYPNIVDNYTNHQWLSDRAILAAKNKDVSDINIEIQNKLSGQTNIYKSIDCVMDPDEAVNYPIEFLNSLDLPGTPPHILQLKIGVPIILLRNLHQPRLCNGTRLAVKQLLNNIIEATILSGKYKGENVLIPRIPIIPSDMPFEFKRIQFPVRLAFAMTINKSQGQSLQVCGLHLEPPCFSHGQLYVGCSRVGKPSSLFIFTHAKTKKNIVYERALQ
ncbi:uncharacterized protein LOC116163953 [Photinus pyralis]|uniref:uncharacterized protein LOC116163953 n=1 Tax=Photinus pyralis TaxID=7054 RepID=UPI001267455D|nr:uncharacterized protein LOC116163953 [Photinus pyralis]